MCEPVSATTTAVLASNGGALAATGAASSISLASVASYASLAATALGTVTQIMGQGQQAAAQQASLNYQAAVNRNNQIIAQRNAEDARARGAVAEEQKRRQTALLIGRQRAVLAGNGIDVNDGSAVDITSDTAATGELDALTTRTNAEREALGYEAQGSNFGSQAALQGFQADNTSATLGQAGTLLSGIGSVADKWYRFKSPSASGGLA